MDKNRDIKEQFLQAILNSERDRANELIDEWAVINGYENALVEVLEPVLEELGHLWTLQKDVSFAQVYVSALIAEDFIIKVLNHRGPSKSQIKKGTIVLGNIEDDFHALGRRLVGIFLMSAGWDVIDLGTDVTPEVFVNTAIEKGAQIIAASAMMYTTAINIQKLREEIDSRGYKNKIMLAVGGAVFNMREDLWTEVGADGSSRNAVDVGQLMDRLLERVQTGGLS